jgi:ketosteroid isomerase-like protein
MLKLWMPRTWKLNWKHAAIAGGVGLALLGSSEITIAQDLAPLHQKASTKDAKITEAEIRNVLDQMLKASRNRDAAGVMKFMADNATIDLTVQTPAGSNKLRLTRQQYAQYLQQGMAAIEQYQAQYSAIKIRVAANGQSAIATYTLQESSVLKNRPIAITAVSNEVVTFQRVQGQLQATALRAIAQVEIKQVDRR